jgi:hypothetical protein
MPFLTLLDPRAKIKGSRDPLGFQLIWTRFGRKVVRNLTTVTTSIRGFTVLLLGFYFAEQAVEQSQKSEADFPALFLKFEQLAACSRVAGRNGNGDTQVDGGNILGILRVNQYLREGNNRVYISAQQEAQILSNQRTYGLWGLYSEAARNSGLLESGHSRLTAVARKFVESEYLPRLDRATTQIFQFLDKDRNFEPRGKDNPLGSRLANILNADFSGSEAAFYSKHILFGGEANSLQHRLWEQILAVDLSDSFSMPELKAVIKQAKLAGDTILAERLEQIKQAETVIAPASQLFGYILSQDRVSAAEVARTIEREWGQLEHLDPVAFEQAMSTVQDIEVDSRARLINLAQAMRAGDYKQTIDLMVEQNKAIMKIRGGDAWVKFKNQQLDVRFRGESEALMGKEQLPDLWVYSYFINSLKTIGYQLNQTRT